MHINFNSDAPCVGSLNPDFIADVFLPALSELEYQELKFVEVWQDNKINSKAEKAAVAGYERDFISFDLTAHIENENILEVFRQFGFQDFYVRAVTQRPRQITICHVDSPRQVSNEKMPDYLSESEGLDAGTRKFLIALEDWQPGHYFQFGKSPWTHWKQGDIVFLRNDMPHWAANFGSNDRKFAMIVGDINEQFIKNFNYNKNTDSCRCFFRIGY